MTWDEGSPAALGDAEALLLETFGLPLLAYMCATDSQSMRCRLERTGTLGSAGEQVLIAKLVPIARVVAARAVERPGLPRVLQMDFLGHSPAEGVASFGTVIREESGAPFPKELLDRCACDNVKATLTRMAIDSYPLLLAPKSEFSLVPRLSHFRHPLRPILQQLVQEDDALRRLGTSDDPGLGRQGMLFSSLGRGGTYQDAMFSEMITLSAWDIVSTTAEHPDLSDLVDQIHLSLDILRSAALGRPTSVPARVAFTGFVMESDDEIQTPWGILRPICDWERRFTPSSLDGTVVGIAADGTEVTVSYAGDVVLETEIPYELVVGDFLAEPPPRWPTATNSIERSVEGIQLAALLCGGSRPAEGISARPTWTWLGDPFGHGPCIGWRDSKSGASFTPAKLSAETCDEFGAWSKRVQATWTPNIDIAVRRLLSAASARTDMADRLVDSVVVWESLFGTSQGESTLRISMAMSWLLGDSPSSREELYEDLKRLYGYRSRIVHGGKADMDLVGTNANMALGYARDALRVLMRDRPRLLDLADGARRSVQLMTGN